MKFRLLFLSVCLIVLAGCQLRPPPFVVQIPAPKLGTTGQVLRFSGYSHSYESDGTLLRFCWGDGDTSQWGEVASGETLTMTHVWTDSGHYVVKVQAKDKSHVSDWLGGQQVAIYDSALVNWAVQVGYVQDECPAVGADGTIYVISDGSLKALAPDGSIKWTKGRIDFGCSPALGPNGAIYAFSSQRLVVLNPDGTTKWVDTLGPTSHPPAIGSDGTIYTASNDSALALDSEGRALWRTALPGLPSASPAIGVDGTICYVVQGDSDAACALSSNGSRKWTVELDYSPDWVSASDSGTFYVGGYCLSAINADGSVAWTRGNLQWSRQAVIDCYGNAFVPCYDGLLVALRAGGFDWVSGVAPQNSVLVRGEGEVVVASNRARTDGVAYHEVVYLAPGHFGWATSRFGFDSELASVPTVGPSGTLYIGTADGYLIALKGSPLAITPWAKSGHDSRNSNCAAVQ